MADHAELCALFVRESSRCRDRASRDELCTPDHVQIRAGAGPALLYVRKLFAYIADP
jgi:hypothetical protein